MFNSIFPVPANQTEGTVLAVDLKSHSCRVKTDSGQLLTRVKWLLPSSSAGRGTETSTPKQFDRVVVGFGLGYPIIEGYLPRIGSDSYTRSISLGSAEAPSIGSYDSGAASRGINPGVPTDAVPGDKIISTDGGAFLGLLRSGTAILKATPLCQLILSKYDDLARLVSRTLEIFTDAGSQYYTALRGRAFRYTGISKKTSLSRNDKYQYEEIIGDVPIGELSKGEVDNLDLTKPLPVESNSLVRTIINVYDQNGVKVSTAYVKDLNVDGSSSESLSGGSVVINVMNNDYNITIGSTTIHATNEKAEIIQGNSRVLLDSAGITASAGSRKLKITESKISLL